MHNAIISLGFSNESTEEPVTLAEAKLFCNIDLDDVDTLIIQLIKSSRVMCEQYANKSLIERTVTAIIRNELCEFALPYGNIQQVNSVQDEYGNDVEWKIFGTLNTGSYKCLRVIYRTTPIEANLAILNQVKYAYENKGTALSNSSKSLLKPYRDI